MFGYARCPKDEFLFEQCSFPAACLGGTNLDLRRKYKQPDGSDPAECNASATCPERCNAAYVAESLLCGSCASGYSHAHSHSREHDILSSRPLEQVSFTLSRRSAWAL